MMMQHLSKKVNKSYKDVIHGNLNKGCLVNTIKNVSIESNALKIYVPPKWIYLRGKGLFLNL
jgi:hypothetical protein